MLRLLLLAAVVTCLGVGGCMAVLIAQRPVGTLPPAGEPPLSVAEMQACGRCHEGATESFLASPHRHTLAAADDVDAIAAFVDAAAPPEVDARRFPLTFTDEGGRLVAANARTGREDAIDWFFGSGRRARTPVVLRPTGGGGVSMVELHITAFADVGLAATPGRDPGTRGDEDDRMAGWCSRGQDAADCFHCHGRGEVIDSLGHLRLDRFVAGLGCDNCHPGSREHLNSGGRSMTGLAVGTGTGASQVHVCGECHRRPADVPNYQQVRSQKALPRFAGASLPQSECFRRGEMSCTTCHDPHLGGTPQEIHAATLASCAECHGDRPDSGCAALATDYDWSPREDAYPATPGRAAALESRDCAVCHMADVKFVENAVFTDHWIRVRTAEDPPIHTAE